MLANREELKAAIKEAQSRVAAIDDEIKTALGKATNGSLPGWEISYKPQSRAGYVVEPKTVHFLRVNRVSVGKDILTLMSHHVPEEF